MLYQRKAEYNVTQRPYVYGWCNDIKWKDYIYTQKCPIFVDHTQCIYTI